MKSETLGTNTSEVEVTQISSLGVRLLAAGAEHFLSFDDFPWFRNAPVSAIHNVQLLNEHHLYWPELDIDLAVESLQQPAKFPLVSR